MKIENCNFVGTKIEFDGDILEVVSNLSNAICENAGATKALAMFLQGSTVNFESLVHISPTGCDITPVADTKETV